MKNSVKTICHSENLFLMDANVCFFFNYIIVVAFKSTFKFISDQILSFCLLPISTSNYIALKKILTPAFFRLSHDLKNVRCYAIVVVSFKI